MLNSGLKLVEVSRLSAVDLTFDPTPQEEVARSQVGRIRRPCKRSDEICGAASHPAERKVLIQPVVNLRLVMGRRSILHKDETSESWPSLNHRQKSEKVFLRKCRLKTIKKPLLKQFQVGSSRNVVVKKDRSNNSLTSNRSPDAYSRRVKRFFAVPARIFVAPVAEILVINVPVKVKMSLVGEKDSTEEVLRQIQLRGGVSNTSFMIHWP